jgi:hypothetical protein
MAKKQKTLTPDEEEAYWQRIAEAHDETVEHAKERVRNALNEMAGGAAHRADFIKDDEPDDEADDDDDEGSV